MTELQHQGFGNGLQIGPETKLECKICWHVYNPAQGCTHWQIPPGTPFTDLPEHWTCPNCSAMKSQFMVLLPDEV